MSLHMLGFVGDGMLNAAVLGDVFTSPTPDQILTGIKQTKGRCSVNRKIIQAIF